MGAEASTRRIDIRDRRLPKPYTENVKQERHRYTTYDKDKKDFVYVRLTDNEVRTRVEAGEELWHGSLGRDGYPKGRRVVLK